jgi:hypothetical protein
MSKLSTGRLLQFARVAPVRLPSYALYGVGRDPIVSAIEPNRGPEAGGTPIELRGSRFELAQRVYIEAPTAVEAPDFVLVSPELITCTTPPGVGPGRVFLFAPSAFVVGQFFYDPPGVEPPRLDSITPNHGPRSGGTPVEIKGNRIGGAWRVRFGFANQTNVETVDDSTLRTVSPTAIGVITIPHSIFVDFDDERDFLGGLQFTYEADP